MISQQDGTQAIRPGVILVKKSALLPEPLHLESDSTEFGWAQVANNLDGCRLEKSLATVGWTLFYMAGAIKATAFGVERQRMIHAALKRLIAMARLQKCNCLEIDDISTHSFCGLRYVNVSAHSRHIQKGMVFCGE